jgi:uncharacterized membrane protein YagU involved in acid resistance
MNNRIDWIRATVVGVLATHIMTMMGFWQAGLGLPKMDVGAMLAGNMGQSYAWGQLAHYLNGILLALIFAAWLYRLLPGSGLVKGIAYGLLTTVAAELVIVPLASPAGIFFSNTPNPGWMVLGGLVPHLAYGVALGLGIELFGELGGEERR